MALQRDIRVKASALLHGEHKVSEVANLVGLSRTTVYAIKKWMDDGEGVNRRADSGRKTVIDRDSLRVAIRGTASNAILNVRKNKREMLAFKQKYFILKYTRGSIRKNKHIRRDTHTLCDICIKSEIFLLRQ